MLYFCECFWYDISVDRGVKYFRRSMHGKCAIYSTWKIYVTTIYMVYSTHVGMSRSHIESTTRMMRLFHACGNESESNVTEECCSVFVPHRWECVDPAKFPTCRRQVYPTQVGMSRSSQISYMSALSLFHAGGNESFGEEFNMKRSKSIPRRWE